MIEPIIAALAVIFATLSGAVIFSCVYTALVSMIAVFTPSKD